MIISSINYALVISLIAILFGGLFLVLRHLPSNVYRHFLVTTISLWLIIFISVLFRHVNSFGSLTPNNGVLDIVRLLLGVPCFLTIISLPAVVLNSRLLKFRSWVIMITPLVVLFTLYFVINALLQIDPFLIYSTEMFWQNITSPPVIMRLILALSFIVYVAFFEVSIWLVTPLYNDYIKDNFSDSSYNVDWVRDLIKYVVVISALYFCIVFFDNQYLNFLYILSVIVGFGYIIDRVLFYKPTEGITLLRITWSFKRGWYVNPRYSSSLQTQPEIPTDISLQQLDSWMASSQMFKKPTFILSDILEAFPDTTQEELTSLFKFNHLTFQGYVRQFRIKEACSIMDLAYDSIISKDIYDKVGFSHYSSFSRAFFAVMHQSPTEYLNNIKDDKESI